VVFKTLVGILVVCASYSSFLGVEFRISIFIKSFCDADLLSCNLFREDKMVDAKEMVRNANMVRWSLAIYFVVHINIKDWDLNHRRELGQGCGFRQQAP